MKKNINDIPCIENTDFLEFNALGFNWISESERYIAFINKIDSTMILFDKTHNYRLKTLDMKDGNVSPLVLDFKIIDAISSFLREVEIKERD